MHIDSLICSVPQISFTAVGSVTSSGIPSQQHIGNRGPIAIFRCLSVVEVAQALSQEFFSGYQIVSSSTQRARSPGVNFSGLGA